ncbi:MAG: aconitase X catalytic domain-containing protein [Gammaproteobacteria bacterium]|nr:aconitase X catalytic domain-containing protein [Gammaproteobacteria bacterium]
MSAQAPLLLDDRDRALLDGSEGEAMRFAMQVVVRAAEIARAERLEDISFAHIDACFYNGQAHVDFARYMVDNGARLAVRAWTNTSLVSQIDEEIRPREDDPVVIGGARLLMDLYERLGCEPVWTCAPYQLPERPELGEHIVASESNAVAFYNSVIGARSNKYGDYLDVCAALVGRVPYAGLHTDEGRRGELLVRLDAVPPALRREDIFHHVLGHYLGRLAGSRVAVIEGLPADSNDDQLKAVSAAAAASGAVALFHALGVTPEAPDADTAFQGRAPAQVVDVDPAALVEARDSLSVGGAGTLAMVALGTPHFSFTEFERLVPLIDGRRVHADTLFYVSTSRHVRARIERQGWTPILERAGVRVIVDTCTYFSPAVRGCRGRVMTNSAKWAYYAPGMLPVEPVFGSLEECVESAVRGEVWRDARLWNGDAWGVRA